MRNVDECFAHQVEFSDVVLAHKGVISKDMTREQLIDWTEYNLFNVVKEACEVTGNYEWKRHRASKGAHDIPAVIDELVDVQKYLWNVFALWGVRTPEQFTTAFAKKSGVVLDRWASEKEQVLADNTDTHASR
jgi:hypothetical protein